MEDFAELAGRVIGFALGIGFVVAVISLIWRTVAGAFRLVTTGSLAAKPGAAQVWKAVDGDDAPRLTKLLAAGADPNAPNSLGVPPLIRAAANGHVAVARALVQAGANVHAEYQGAGTALQAAAGGNHKDLVALLLTAGANPNTRDSVGDTPLHEAGIVGSVPIVRMLIDHGAIVTASTFDGATPLHGAAMRGHVEVMKLLLDSGANINAAAGEIGAPIQVAAEENHLAAVTFLLQAGAIPDVANHLGVTALHHAAKNGNVEMARALIVGGATVGLAAQGVTPLDVAQEMGHHEVARLLADSSAPAVPPIGASGPKRFCTGCGALNKAQGRFCANCGQAFRVTSDQPLPTL